MNQTLEDVFGILRIDRGTEDNPMIYPNPIEIPNSNRETLAWLFHQLGFTIGAEIGTERGLYAEVLLQKNPNLELYCVDAWTAYKGYRDHVTQAKLDGIYRDAFDRLHPYGRCKLVRGFSLQAADEFEDGSLDFVYIDANHEYRQVVDDISTWEKKVRKGGIVSGHDYIKRKNKEYQMHVIEAVSGYVSAYQINPYFLLGSKNPEPGELRDRPRSWFWVKE